jgi:electron transport complex protein RnfG
MSESEHDLLADLPTSSEQTVKIYAVVLSVGVVCSLAIVTVYEATRPIIERNKMALRQDAILDVLADTTTIATFRLHETTGQFQPTSTDASGSDLVFAGFDRHGELVGLAIETQGMGYQDTIGLLYGYSPDDQAIIGIRVLESRETPGLGDRIETDADFLRNFERLVVGLNADGTGLAHPIEFVKTGKKTSDWQIDGITGATISSRAIAQVLRDSTAYWIPRVYPRRTDFARPASKE